MPDEDEDVGVPSLLKPWPPNPIVDFLAKAASPRSGDSHQNTIVSRGNVWIMIGEFAYVADYQKDVITQE